MESPDFQPSSRKKILKCTFPGCVLTFAKTRALNIHVLKHTNERPFVCDVEGCTKSFTNTSHLKRHINVSHGDEKRECVMCDYEGCGLSFANKYSLKKHVARKHNPEKVVYKCEKCKREFLRKKHLQIHVCAKADPIESTYKCELCEDRYFSTPYLLSKHKWYHRTYNCECGVEFYTWSLLLKHKKKCKTCKYRCEICQKLFVRQTLLDTHKLSHQEKSERLVFTCPYEECGRFYFYKTNLQQHIDSYHKKLFENNSYKCTYPRCKAVLKTKVCLKNHYNRHFEWKEKKERKPRHDKGIKKKSILSLIVGELPKIDKINETENTTIVQTSNQDDIILQQCDLTMKKLNEAVMQTN